MGSSASSFFNTFAFTVRALTCHMVGTPAALHFELTIIPAARWNEEMTMTQEAGGVAAELQKVEADCESEDGSFVGAERAKRPSLCHL